MHSKALTGMHIIRRGNPSASSAGRRYSGARIVAADQIMFGSGGANVIVPETSLLLEDERF